VIAEAKSMDPAARSVPPARPRRPGRWLARLLAVVMLGLLAYHGWVLRQVWRLRDHDPHTTAFMRHGLERLRSADPTTRLQHLWVPYGHISEHLSRAVLAAEDQRFLDHHGFDLYAIHEAYARNAHGRRIRHGASTISQQLAKNLFLSPRRTYLRKAREAAITMMIEQVLGKRRILEIYLNVIEWGTGIYGAEAAAWHYYGKTAADLAPEEAARLAAIIPSPRLYTRNPSTPYLEQRIELLLGEMEDVRIP
jgi:monofunctional biosynthetic peptidoglycan transglycosylase